MSAVLIGLDWGTTHVRAARLDAHGEVLAHRQAPSGVGQHDENGFHKAFDALTDGWEACPVLACGMIGSRQGWVDAPYLDCPASADDLSAGAVRLPGMGRAFFILPGLRQQGESRFDVMRGEETQLVGFLAQQPEFDGVVVLPGTHSKWVRIEKGRVTHFSTLMTGEVFSLLAEQSILRSGLQQGTDDAADDAAGFAKGVALSRDGGWDQFFKLRAEHLLAGTDAAILREKLSGLLIGAEIRSALALGFRAERVEIIGASGLALRYQRALEQMGMAARCHDGSALVWQALADMAGRMKIMERA